MADVPTPASVSLLRPDDLLNLTISPVNLRLVPAGDDGPMLVVDDERQPGLLIVRFPPQTIFEEAFFEQDANPPLQKLDPPEKHPAPPALVRAPAEPGDVAFRLGAETRLVFRVPPDARIPYTTAGLLDWSTFELVVAPIADVAARRQPSRAALTIRAPEDNETTLQLPFRLHLSPTHLRRLAARYAEAVTPRGRDRAAGTPGSARSTPTAARIPSTTEHPIGLRAIWSPDYRAGRPGSVDRATHRARRCRSRRWTSPIATRSSS